MVEVSTDDITDKDSRFLLILLFIPCLFIRLKFNSDTYWLINSGRYVIAHGIPHIEPFTFHQGLHFVMQQWLSATVFALIYNSLGSPFLFVLVAIVNCSIIYSIFRLCLCISEGNFLVSFTIAFAISIPLSLFMVLRPYLFSVFLFSIELNLLEAWLQTELNRGRGNPTPEMAENKIFAFTNSCCRSFFKKNSILWGLPILSVLLVNLHAALWPFFFVLLLPYFIDSFRFNLWGVKGQGYPCLPLCIAAALSLIAGWLNPYGLESMTYLFHSYGSDYMSTASTEMQSPDFKNAFGIFVFIIYISVAMLFSVNCKNKTRLRYVLLIIGTGYLGLSSIRNTNLFLVCGIPFLAYTLREVQITITPRTQPGFPWLRHVLLSILVVFLGAFFMLSAGSSEQKTEIFLPVKALDYIKNNLNTENIRLYTGYETGGYAEFQGLRPFIDARAEVFFKSNNQKSDIIGDYFDARLGKAHYRKLIDKYNLTHFLVGKTDILFVYLPKDPDFEMLFSDEDFRVFALKTVTN
jgi:hypothetical protein